MNRYQYITTLYAETLDKISSPDKWTGFLSSACRNYRLEFHEQVLLYAQRPDAVAVLPMKKWNTSFGRWVNRGAKGIALFDGKEGIKYFFDISDTHESKYSRPVRIWSAEDYGSDIALLFGKETLQEALLSYAGNTVEEKVGSYMSDLLLSLDGSYLDGYDEQYIQSRFVTAVKNSVGYMLLSRLGCNADDFFITEDFRSIADFNTPSVINAVGTAVSDISGDCLDEISRMITNIRRQRSTFAEKSNFVYDTDRNEERNTDNERNNLHTHRGDLHPGYSSDTGDKSETREVRNSQEGIPERTSQDSVYEPTDDGNTERPSGRGGRQSVPYDEPNHISDVRISESDGEDERSGQSEMDTADEQHKTIGGGDSSERADIRLKHNQPSLFDISYDESEDSERVNALRASLFSLPEEVTDEALRMGSNHRNSRLIICAYFMKDKTNDENAVFLKNHYLSGGGGFYYDGNKYSVWYDSEGISIAFGDTAKVRTATHISWEDASLRIRRLLDEGKYMPESELLKVRGYELEKLADRLIFTSRDISDEYEQEGYLPTLTNLRKTERIFPSIQQKLVEMLNVPEMLDVITQEWEEFSEDHKNNPDILRFRHYRPYEELVRLRNLQLEQLDFTAEEFEEKTEYFITEDEISAFLIGGGSNEYERKRKKDIASFFAENTDTKVRENYIRDRYGTSGSSGGRFNYESDSKGLKLGRGYMHQPHASVHLTWKEVTARFTELIRGGYFDVNEPEVTVNETKVIPQEKINFRITDDNLGYGTVSEKYAANIAAIKCLDKIEKEGRLATAEEQDILSKYVGWGGLSDCFEEGTGRSDELKELLTEEEYISARQSTLTAFYTSPVIIRAVYKAIENMGFSKGNILEPSCGTGNFIGLLPESMAQSSVYGVELDSVSGSIAHQLYQKADISVMGYEDTDFPDSFFDVAVGNVPFGDFKVADKRYDKENFLIHDYFFAATLDKVRPGGIIAFITSKGTLDKENPNVRKYLARRAELLGAVRLPDNAFKKNAGTEVTSDIIFLQKRDKLTDIEPEWVNLGYDSNGIRLNRYFVDHPEMILGNMVMQSSRFGQESACKAREGEELSVLLNIAVSKISAKIVEYEVTDPVEEDNYIPATADVKNFSFSIADDKIYYRENSRMYPVNVSAMAEKRIRGMIELRQCVRRLITLQTEDYPDEDILSEQANLNGLYDDFTKEYGLISSRANSMAFGDDSSYYLLCSLEILDEDGNLKRKADMFTKRTIRSHVAVTKVDTASEALAVSISEKAKVDIDYMSILTGKSHEELMADLKGVVFRDIVCPEISTEISGAFFDFERYPLVTSDEYLSGNVRRKLKMAKALYEALPEEKKEDISVNISSLEAVRPADLTAGEISVRIGANWVPVEIYEEFMYELFGTGYYAQSRINIIYSAATGSWNITNKSADGANIRAVTTYGTGRVNGYHILEQTFNQKTVEVYDTVTDEYGNERRIINRKETALAQDKQELIKERFSEWIWQDIDRREKLCSVYNERFNAIRTREYDGSHITFSGMNPEITLREHQINAVARIMYGGNTLLAHEVGAGKTFEIVAAAMESKRLGLCTKSLVVVPNHITEQWASEWLQLYPSANILVATKKDFETKNRKKFCAKIATGDYDAVIIGHSQFEKIPVSKERQQRLLREQIDDIIEGIQDAKAARAERYTVKQLERTKKSLEVKLQKLNDTARKDDVVTFEELGIDRLFVDEAHQFKNLFLATKMRNVGGISQTEAQKSSDLFMKCRYLDEITGGRGVIFATGTPISNSMVEVYTMQRYLQYDMLKEMELIHFDDWAATYGETVTAIELAPEGSGYRAKTRFAKFHNLPELMSVFGTVADIQTSEMLNLPVPEAEFHTKVIKPSELQKKAVEALSERAEAIRSGGVDPTVDNMLKVTNYGRKLALDMRLIQPLAPDNEDGKIAVCAKNVYDIWKRTESNRSTQLIFCDISTPKEEVFNAYYDLREKLINAGIPGEEIAFIHNAGSEAKKKELFSKVRSGQIRILMGSTQKMGAGTNCQDRLIALHDLDCPWRPSDLTQRLGRIVRQGNMNGKVEIYRYVTENTFDAYMFQTVENKQRFISQIMTGKTPVRVAEDIDEAALSYAEIKALATGNPLIIEKCNLDVEVSKLTMLRASYLNQKYALENLVHKKYPADILWYEQRISGYESDIKTVKEHPIPTEGFVGMTLKGIHHTEKASAGKAVLEACRLYKTSAENPGTYRGFEMYLTYDGIANEYHLTLRGQLSHTVVLGTDTYGNITRIDNVLENLPDRLEKCRMELANVKTQLENAKAELSRPFEKEDELKEKSKRLSELNVILNLDKNERVVMDEYLQADEVDKEKCVVR